ncbi:MAG: hypothetical protein ABH950_01265 [Candidatus Altiarchaeota archaeon]
MKSIKVKMNYVTAVSHLSGWLVDARLVGKAAVFSLGLETKVTVEEADRKGIIVEGLRGNVKAKGGKIVRAVAAKVLKKNRSKKGLRFSIASAKKSIEGLGAEESIAAATALATYGILARGQGSGMFEFQVDKTLRRQFVQIKGRVIPTEEMIEDCLAAVPTLSFTRLAVSFYGGFVVADEKKRETLRRGEMEEKITCEILPLKEKPLPASSFTSETEIVWAEALKGNLYTASNLNAILNCSNHQLLEKTKKQKGVISLSYSPPTLIVLHRKKTKKGKEEETKKGGKIPINNEPVRIQKKPKRILRIREFLELKPEGEWKWI